MSMQLYCAFIVATTILMLMPGPNVALIVANSVAYGPRYGLLTVAGTSSAMVIQLALTGLGMSELLGHLAVCFEYVRWVGVVYLIYLGVKQWIAAPVNLSGVQAQPRSPKVIYLRGFFVSLTNPKTLFFYGAFFPQFLSQHAPVLPQVVLLSSTFLLLAIVLDASWALLAGRLRTFLASRGKLRNRLSGGMLIGAGVGLALARKR
jgi:threonine/homoserine/homoserine lactone efflux protein